jgi:3-isopropylmalate dehydrogenase
MEIKIACIAGEGIGPEILESTKKVINKVAQLYGHTIIYIDCIVGSEAVNIGKDPFDEEAYDLCEECDGILLGNMWMHLNPELPKEKRPSALLGLIRKKFNLSINIRPNYIFEGLEDLSPLKENVIQSGFDVTLIRDLAGGELTGERYRDEDKAYDVDLYTKEQILNLAKFGFETSLKRKCHMTFLDKAVILESSRFSREIIQKEEKQYPNVSVRYQHIDDAASEIVLHPNHYDVIITNGMFGDILADEIAGLSGIQKMLPSAELNVDGFGLYTPNNLHNTDANINRDESNPIGLIMASAMLFRYSLDLEQEAQCIENAVSQVLKIGYCTKDFNGNNRNELSTSEFVSKIIKEMKR